MGYAMCQARFTRDNALPEDAIVNTFHFITPTTGQVTQTEANDLSDRIHGFYNTVWTPSTVSVRSFMSQVLTGTMEVKVYDMEQATPRVPIYTESYTTGTGATALPSEVALCISYRGALQSGTVPARRRGRIYIGPLAQIAVAVHDGSDVRPTASCINTFVQAAYSGLQQPVPGGAWAVASQPTPGGPITLTPVTAVWVDNALDTQRRRGAAPNARTLLGV